MEGHPRGIFEPLVHIGRLVGASVGEHGRNLDGHLRHQLGVATAQDEHCPDCGYGRIAASDGSRAREPPPSVPRGNETIHRCAGPVPR